MTILTQQLGFGNSGFGASYYGFGSPAVSAIINNAPMETANNSNQSLAARLIDTSTGDFVIFADGNTAGMPSATQQVLLAVSTVLGSAANTNVGNTVRSVQTLGPNFVSQFQGIFQQALQNLVSAGTISLVRIDVFRLPTNNNSTVNVNIYFIDNSNNSMQTLPITVSG